MQELAGCAEARAVHADLPVQVVSAGRRDIPLLMASRRALGAPSRITAELSFDGSGGIDGVFAGGTGYLVCERNLEL